VIVVSDASPLIGVLLEAKAKGLLPSVAQTLDELTTNAGFRVGSALREAVLRAANELPLE
jgi:predicted nucleic acid-binding protein